MYLKRCFFAVRCRSCKPDRIVMNVLAGRASDFNAFFSGRLF